MSLFCRYTSVRRILLLLAGSLTAAFSSSALVAAPQQPDRTIYVSAVGSTGMPVTDLTAADFIVKEDSTAREVASIGKATEPVYFAILLDTSNGATGLVQHMRDAVQGFCKTVLTAAPDSKILLMDFGGAGTVRQEFTSDLAALEAMIPKILPKPSEPVLTEALVDISQQMAKVPSRRRVIVTINHEPSNEAGRLDVKQVAEAIRKSGASVWGISIRGAGGRQDANRDNLLKGAAANSGGIRVTLQTPVPLPDYMRSVAANSIVQYAVTFKRPADAPPPKITSVSINRQGVTALTLQWSDK